MNPWDKLSEHFNAKKNIEAVDTDAADNILIAWPVILEQIARHYSGDKHISILDYGCGAGSLCEKLYSLGYHNVIGVDSSAGMIQKAAENYGDHISFIEGSATEALEIEPVDVITSIHALQFVDDIQTVFNNLERLLKPGGLFIFAVHNPETVRLSLERGQPLWSGFDGVPGTGSIHLGGNTIPAFIRSSDDYTKLADAVGLTKIFEDYPPFTPEFLAKYETNVPDVSEFMILGYWK